MTVSKWLTIVGVVAAIAAPRSECFAQQKWGSLKGQFVYDAADAPKPDPLAIPGGVPAGCPNCKKTSDELLVDPDTKGVRNIVVYLMDEDGAIHPSYNALIEQPAVLDNKDCRFEPHVLALWLKQPLRITNSDACGHNAACSPKKEEPFNPLLQPKTDYVNRFAVPQTLPQPVSCAIHPWMKGYVLPRATPYVAVTNAQGEFEIADLPAGQHQFRVWHERAGYLLADPAWIVGRNKGVATWTIEADKTTDAGVIKVDPKLLAPK
ncbi:MAG TPA: hypothetical protein VGE52_01620 [Pirellulales bacterium]